jgi:hypothetical protein
VKRKADKKSLIYGMYGLSMSMEHTVMQMVIRVMMPVKMPRPGVVLAMAFKWATAPLDDPKREMNRKNLNG